MPKRILHRLVANPAQRVTGLLSDSFERFVRTESSSGILLLAVAVVALVWANSPWAESYFAIWHTEVALEAGSFRLEKHLSHWINDGLMAIFFLLVGLEIKREVIDGELSSFKKALLPIATAGGGMLFPALIYVAFNTGGPGERGWAIPTATDIAFALGILTLAGSAVPIGLKVVLTALAIVDDLGAVIIIALFYTDTLAPEYLLYAGLLVLLLVLLNLAGVRNLALYLLPGVVLWYCVLKSGVHATIGGVLLALTIPANTTVNPPAFLTQSRRRLEGFKEACEIEGDEAGRHSGMQAALEELEDDIRQVQSPLLRLEHGLKNWVAFGIMPIFALANAGVALGSGVAQHLTDPITLGILLGLFLGKQLGVLSFAWLFIRLGWADKPAGVSWRMLYGIACLAGIGFTMSLFVADLSFEGSANLDYAKVGILAATTLSAVYGILILKRALRRPAAT
ncbi:MAG: Na+/H+ antiporter NhaA [Bacteroidia bacterium]|nr:Na+/H+ antiporter NhaA [Bacteroidia bacterium]